MRIETMDAMPEKWDESKRKPPTAEAGKKKILCAGCPVVRDQATDSGRLDRGHLAAVRTDCRAHSI